MTYSICNPLLRFSPPTSVSQLWTALDLAEKKTYFLHPLHIYILLNSRIEKPENKKWEKIKRHYELSDKDFDDIYKVLEKQNLLVAANNEKTDKYKSLYNSWKSMGWMESFDYHILTYNYPFLDYKEAQGHEADVRRMRLYEEEKLDNNRYKEYKTTHASLDCYSIHDYLASLTSKFPLPLNHSTKQDLTQNIVKQALTSTFGVLRTRRPFGVPEAQPLLRKTSPSGGARHPTEAYLLNLNIKDMESGLYHYNMQKNCLDLIKSLPDFNVAEKMEGLFRIIENPDALIFMTSVFERNRYRYREPRTLRTIFMDAGHLAMTLKIVTESLGIDCFFHHGVDENCLENYIGIDPYEEGFIIGAALKGKAKNV